MAKVRRNFTPEFKAQVALDALRETESIEIVAQHHGVPPVLANEWRREAQERMVELFSPGKSGYVDYSGRDEELRQRINLLERELIHIKGGSPHRRVSSLDEIRLA